jgi:spore germination cell wall hydrolase CwlJ-like protein
MAKLYLIPEWQWAVLTIAQEASSEPYTGKVAVAEVIRNRMKTRHFSDGTIQSTVLWPYQFSGWNTRDPNRTRAANYELDSTVITDCIKAFKAAFESDSNFAMGANLYHAQTMKEYPSWTRSPKVQRLVQIGNHIFYKESR